LSASCGWGCSLSSYSVSRSYIRKLMAKPAGLRRCGSRLVRSPTRPIFSVPPALGAALAPPLAGLAEAPAEPPAGLAAAALPDEAGAAVPPQAARRAAAAPAPNTPRAWRRVSAVESFISSEVLSGRKSGGILLVPSGTVKTQQRRRVAVQDAFGVLLGQPRGLDVGEALFVALVLHDDRVVAAGHELAGAVDLRRQHERLGRGMRHRVVEQLARGHPRLLRQVAVLPGEDVVDPPQQDRQKAAQVGDDEADVGIAHHDPARHEVQGQDAVLQRVAHAAVQLVVANEGR